MEKEKKVKKVNYYWGFDIGTNSVGYAVTDENYNIIKHGGEPMWGSHIFEEGSQAAERRSHRTARRRNDRKKQRIKLLSDIFAPEIAKIDERFFIRRCESGLFRNEVDDKDRYIMFSEDEYTDKEYYAEYPTIHHLINELMNSNDVYDVRLVYIACAYLVAHRGHFLSEVNKDNIDELLDFDSVYKDFIKNLENCGYDKPWECEIDSFKTVLKRKTNVTNKEKSFLELLNGGKKFKLGEDDEIDKNGLIKLLSGGKYELNKIFPKLELEEGCSVCFRQSEEEFESALVSLGEEAIILSSLRNIYDWTLLSEICKDGKSVSSGKVDRYEQHKEDLKFLKEFVKKYIPDKYNEIFKNYASGKANYVLYSYNFKNVKEELGEKTRKATSEQFCDYIKKVVTDIDVDESDRAAYDDMLNRLSAYTFMPKQVVGDNRVIPYQLYYYELKTILDNAKGYLPFLLDKDENGYSNIDKILSIMEFRVPYYVGPLRADNGQHAWVKRKAEGKIYPWNFEEKVDLDASEEEFINRMTNKCTYIAGENVLPKYSLLYCSYNVLNEINNIRINGEPISIEHKHGIYRLFEKYKKVTFKRINDYLVSNNLLHSDDVLSGLDTTIKSSLKSYHDFKKLMENGIFTQNQVEEIIERLTYCEEKFRIVRWLNNKYPDLPEEDVRYISKLKYNNFGRLSRRFLAELEGCSKQSGEVCTIIRALWETNDNLMQLLSDKYTFLEEIEAIRKDYYSKNSSNIDNLLNEMYVGNAVRRPIYRTLDIIEDIKKVCATQPKRIFVEMPRGGGEKGKRTKSRRDQIKDLYSHMDKQEIRELSEQLEGKSDNELQSEVLFLYFMQLGKSAYSDTPLDIDKLKTSAYNVDHIYPQCRVKDDSINNKVLVLSQENSDKGDEYPIKSEIQNKMSAYWQNLRKNNLISEEKYKRLTRKSSFKEEELQGFINRQLVETSQASKAITVILKEMFSDAEIVFVKAGLVSDFRQQYDMLKTRSVNDNHHAKDAYLNIVAGNVYHCRFTKNFYIDREYSLKTKTIFNGKVSDGQKEIWNGVVDLSRIRTVVSKNNIHYTRYAFIRKGKLFNQMPLKAKKNLVPRKAGLDTAKYGGYSNTTAAGFVLVKYKESDKAVSMIMPIELMYLNKFLQDESSAIEYARYTIENIWNKKDKISEIEFPMGRRILKVNTMLSFDGFKACITRKANGGRIIGLTSMIPLVIGNEWEQYVKKLETFINKKEKNASLEANEEYDGICIKKNMELYDILSSKVIDGIYKTAFYSQKDILKKGRDKFEKLSVEDQIKMLMTVTLLLKSGRAGSCNFELIGGTKDAGVYDISSKINNWKKNFTDVRIVDVSASGIYETKSFNLLELI